MVKPIILPISYKSDPKGLRKAEQDLKGFASGIGKAIGVATAAVAGIGIASVRTFAQFDSAMNQSLAIMGDVSDELRNNMSDAAREVAKATTFSANEAAESYFFLASAGLSAEQSIAALPKVAAFAQAGMFDMATATDLLTDAQSALGLTSDDAAENLANMANLGDVLVKANTLANASVEQFASALTNKAAASMRTLNVDMEEGVAVLGVFADQGLKGEQAGTAFNATMIGLTKTARTNASAYEALGVSVFDSTGELNNMADIVADLEKGLEGMSTEQVDATLASLGLTRQALDGTKALLGNSDAIREYEDELRNAGGTVDEVAEKQLQTLSAQFEILQSKINDVGIEIGTKLGPTMETLVDALGPVIDQVGDVLVEAFELLAPVIADAAKQLPGLLSALVPVLPLMVDIARTVLQLAIQLLPIFLGVIQQLLPLVQRFANFIADNADKVGIFAIALGGLILSIKAFNIILGISKLIKVTWAAAMGVATVAQKGLNAAMKANPIGIIITLVAALVAALIWFFTQTETGQRIWQAFVDVVMTTVRAIGNFFRNIFGEVLPGIWQSMVKFFTDGWDKFKDFFFKALGAIGDFFKGIINGWIGLFENFVNGIIRGLNWVIRQANRFRINVPSTPFGPGFTIGFNLAELSNIQLPRLAEGGIVNRETLAIIGEAGPEAVVPLDKMGTMGATYNITVNAGFGTDGPQVAEQIVRLVRRYERNSGPVFARA
jgi:TP901 family phage tail tape measure protein